MEFFRARDDIAMIELYKPVTDIEPISLYTDSDKQGRRVVIMGRGATGNGNIGKIAETKEARILRQCENRIVEAKGEWLIYEFNHPNSAEPLEGMHGSGLVVDLPSFTRMKSRSSPGCRVGRIGKGNSLTSESV